MSNQLVTFSIDDDGQEIPNDDWHLVDPANVEGSAKLCSREFFGCGESGVMYTTKLVKRGGITCKNCLDIISTYKAVKL